MKKIILCWEKVRKIRFVAKTTHFRIRSIRAGERRIWQQITDIFAAKSVCQIIFLSTIPNLKAEAGGHMQKPTVPQ